MAQPMAQPMQMAQPVMAQPVMMQPVMAAQAADGSPAPPGAPPGGAWSQEQYSGQTSMIIMIILILFFWPALCAPFCCLCDTRAPLPPTPAAALAAHKRACGIPLLPFGHTSTI